MSTNPVNSNNTVPSQSTQTFPNAPSDPEAIIGFAKILSQSQSDKNYDAAFEQVKNIFSCGQILAAKAFLNAEHQDFLLDIILTLLEVFQAPIYDHKPHQRFLIARTLRLFAELEMLRSLESHGTSSDLRIENIVNKLQRLITHAEDQECSGLKFELRCVEGACHRWKHKSHIWKKYGSDFIKLFAKASALELEILSDACALIGNLRKEQSGSWYDTAFYVGFLGSLATHDEAVFIEIHEIVKEAFNRRTTFEDKKILLSAADFFADVIWRGSPQIKSWALYGREGAPGLIQLSQIEPNKSMSKKLTDIGQNISKKAASYFGKDTLTLWGVQYHSCCLLSALQECEAVLPDSSKVCEKAKNVLSNRNTDEEKDKTVAKLINEAVASPLVEYRSLFDVVIDPQEPSDLLTKQTELDERDKKLQEREQSLEEEKRSAEILLQQATVRLEEVDSSKRDLRELGTKILNKQAKHFEKFAKEISPEEVDFPLAKRPLDRELPIPLKGLYQDFQERHFGKNKDAQLFGEAFRYSIPSYVRPNVLSKGEESTPIGDKIKDFLQGSLPVLLLHGDSGAGKSFYAYLLEQRLWNDWMEGGIVPIYIDLKTLKTSITDRFLEMKYSINQIETLIDKFEFLLILDGFDEMKKHIKIQDLLPEKWEKCRIFVTCRTQFILNDSDYWARWFSKQARADYTEPLPSNECYLTPITSQQVETYIKKRGLEDNFQIAEKKFPQLQEMTRTPLLLCLLSETLPKLVSKEYIDRADVYTEFINLWFGRAFRRLEEAGLLSETNNKDKFREFAEELAMNMYFQGSSEARRTETPFKALFESTDSEVRDACPLRFSSEEKIVFFHKSFMEYFAAAYFLRQIAPSPPKAPQASEKDLKERLSTHPLKKAREGKLFHHALLHSEPALLDFLIQLINKKNIRDYQDSLVRILKDSKGNPDLNILCANVMTILNWMRYPFSGMDLKGLQAPGADLEGGIFHFTDLSGGNFESALFSQAQLVETNLTQSKCTDTDFGQGATIKIGNAFNCFICHPTKKKIAVSSSSTSNNNSETEYAIEIWDSEKGNPVRYFHGNFPQITCMAYSPKGDLIVSANCSKEIVVWSANWATKAFTLKCNSEVTSICFCPTGNFILSASKDNILRLWSITTKTVDGSFSGHTDTITSVSFSSNGKYILSGSADQTARIWERKSFQCEHILKGHTQEVTAVAFDPNSLRALTSGADHAIKLWATETGELVHTFDGHENSITCLCFDSEGEHLASGDKDGRVLQWSTKTKQLTLDLEGHTGPINSICYSPTGNFIFSGSADQTIRQWSAKSQYHVASLERSSDPITGILKQTDKKLMLDMWNRFASSQKNAKEDLNVFRLTHLKEAISSTRLHPDGKRFIFKSQKDELRQLGLKSAQTCNTLRGHTDEITDFCYNPNGNYILTCSKDQTARLWATNDGKELRLFQHPAPVTSISFSPNGNIIITGNDKEVRLWNANNSSPTKTLRNEKQAAITCILFPFDHEFFVGDEEGKLHCWSNSSNNSQSFAFNRISSLHKDRINSLCINSSKTLLLTVGQDGTAKITDLKNRKKNSQLIYT
ncbi:MAG: hypothetical protein K1000chlam2_01125, partial [Chlamydiae bacterium]|nr:hypothetical protein [Chlamydiota bacterium]